MAEITDEKAEEIAKFFENAIIPTTTDNTPHASIVPVTEDKSLSPRFADIVQSVMNEAQYTALCGKTPEHAIRTLSKGGTTFKYTPHGYTRDQLNKAFGFDWDFEVMPLFGGMPFYLVEREEKTGPVKYLTVAGKLTVRIRNPHDITQVITTITKTEFGSQAWRAAMEFGDALKAASSDALKRCGLSLGVALDLYYDDDDLKRRFDNLHELQNSTKEDQQAREIAVKLHQENKELKPIQIVTELKKRGLVTNVPQVQQWIG